MRDRQGGIIGATVTPTTSTASGVWTLQEAQRFQRGGTWPEPVVGDQYFSSVSLLLHMDGSSSTFVDSSSNNRTVTAYGNATQSSAQSKWGGKSAYFDGSEDYLSVPNSSAFNFGSGNWVVEFWMYASAQSLAPICHQTSLSSQTGWILWNYDNVSAGNTTRKLTLMLNGANYILTTSGDAYADNTWTHIAVVRSGSTITMYSNGTYAASGTFSDSISDASQPFWVGGISSSVSWNGTRWFNGYIDDLRVTAGSDRGLTGATITVPTAAFADYGPSSSVSVAPTSVSGIASNAQVSLSWTAPASNGGSVITGYVVEYTPSGGSASTVSTGSTSASYTVTGLTNGTAYTFRVAAVNAIGTGAYSTASGSVTPSAGGSYTPTAVLLTSGTSYTVPTGATTMKAWAVGAGSNRAQAGAVAYKTYTVSGGASVTYVVGPAPGSSQSDWYLSGKSSVTYGGSTVYAEGGRVGTTGSAVPGYGGGDGGVTSATLSSLGQTRILPGIGGTLASSTSPCKRRPATDVSGLLAAVSLAGGKTTEDCNLSLPAFGSGGVDDKFATCYPSGYGGGGGTTYGNGTAASGAVVLYFT